MSAIQRLNRELREIKKNPNSNFSGSPKDNNMLEWEATIMGPVDTPYEGGIFHLRFLFTDDYPFTPPKVNFITKIYHPNINGQGLICCDTLKEGWNPALTVSKILLSLCSLLSDPNPDDPLEAEIANQYQNNRDMYFKTAKEWTITFA